MRCDGDDRNLALSRTITPKNAICAGCAVLGIGFENRRAGIVGMFEGIVLMRVKTRMPGVIQEFLNAVVNLLEQALNLRSLLIFAFLRA